MVLLAGAAAALLVSGCRLDVTWRDRMPTGGLESPPIHLPVYPRAIAVTPPLPSPPDGVSFTGRFADTSIQSWQFATGDDVDRVLYFYRDAMRTHGAPLVCRGTINVRATRRTQELRCLGRGARDSVQLAVSVPGQYAVVSVRSAGIGSTFTLMNVGTRR
jgi:hypothetical protein